MLARIQAQGNLEPSEVKKVGRREPINSRPLNARLLRRKPLLRDGANSLLFCRFRVGNIIWLVGVVVLTRHHRILGNLIEVVIEKRKGCIVDVV